jgi:DNA repair protein RadC
MNYGGNMLTIHKDYRIKAQCSGKNLQEIRSAGTKSKVILFPSLVKEATAPSLSGPAEVIRFMGNCFDERKDQEQLWVVFLNSANRPVGKHMATLGLVNQTQCDSRVVFSEAIKRNAVGIIVLHNHPSGQLSASPEDIAATKQLVQIGKVLEIAVMDHIIVVPHVGFTSIKGFNPWIFGE